jgi:hypothetical protein
LASLVLWRPISKGIQFALDPSLFRHDRSLKMLSFRAASEESFLAWRTSQIGFSENIAQSKFKKDFSRCARNDRYCFVIVVLWTFVYVHYENYVLDNRLAQVYLNFRWNLEKPESVTAA